MAKARKPLVLPALRGRMGDWIYYSVLVPMRQLADRVSYAQELKPRDEQVMSEFIQRALEETTRVEQIANYLTTTERFFNSLVLALYGGDPSWLDISLRENSTAARSASELLQGWGLESLGLLELTGREKIFAIDGQHRLAGIKEALNHNDDLGEELVSALFVGHKNTQAGMLRTRRLFTTLNKTAVKVRKRDIIALDEDDVMAILARRFVETNDWFRPPKISLLASSSMAKRDQISLTTIGNLYDVLNLLFRQGLGYRNEVLRFNRPPDKKLAAYETFALKFFRCMHASFPPVAAYLDASPSSVKDHTHRTNGGHLVFRPIGLEIVADAYCYLHRQRQLKDDNIAELFSKMPVTLSAPPYEGLIWNPRKDAIITKGKALTKRVVRYMLGDDSGRASLLGDYQRSLEGIDDAMKCQLPARL